MSIHKKTMAIFIMAIASMTSWTGEIPNNNIPDHLALAIQVAEAKLQIAMEAGYTPPEGDVDQDGIPDAEEYEHGTDPFWPDTDNDRWPDGYELANGTDPLVFDNEEWLQRIAQGGEDLEAMLYFPNPACVIATFNPKTCIGTCTGKCLLVVPCHWWWDPVQFAIDIYYGAPCPGWTCHCP